MQSKDDWQQLIEQYRQDMMRQYAASSNQAPTNEPVIEESNESKDETPFTANEANEESDPNITDELTDIGQLQLRISTENQAVPIPGAVITVTKQLPNGDQTLIRTIIADENGLTPIIDLPTKDRSLSLVPGNPAPYAVYTVDVSADGYFSKRFIDLPIYGGVIAVQSVSMIPLPEEGADDAVLSYPQNGPTL